MKIEHVGIWAKDIEKLKAFYEKYFNAKSNDIYINPKKNFKSYFLSFDSGSRLEIMHKPKIPDSNNDIFKQFTGIVHISFKLKSENEVDDLAERLKNDGIKIYDGPRRTGDGCYEAACFDPEGNRIEMMY